MTEDERTPQEGKDPGYLRVRDFMLFGMSLPERTLRSATGMISGAVRESASLLVPQAFRNSKSYNIFIQQGLDFLAEDIGGVERKETDEETPKVENYVARKAIGNFVELAGLATFHLSPMTILAIFSDVAYGSQAYLKELADDLKEQGVIAEDSTINHVDDLLNAVAGTAGTAATAFDTPPLSVDGLKQTIAETRESVSSINPTKVIPQAEIKRLWDEIHETATSQGVNPVAVSSAMTLYSLNKIGKLGRGALSTVTVAGKLFDRHMLQHYGEALGDIRERGIYTSLAESSRPYINAVWMNFSTEKTSITEDIFSGRLVCKAWGATWGWFACKKDDPPEAASEDVPAEDVEVEKEPPG